MAQCVETGGGIVFESTIEAIDDIVVENDTGDPRRSRLYTSPTADEEPGKPVCFLAGMWNLRQEVDIHE